MKLLVDIAGEKMTVELERDGTALKAKVNEREYNLEVSQPEKQVVLLKRDGDVFEARVSKGSDGDLQIRMGEIEYAAKVTDPKKLRGIASSDSEEAGRAEMKTSMPGKVVRLLVTEGQEVSKGDGIVVVEAMKMQNELKSPKDGSVTSIKVAENDTVGAGDVLVIID